MSYIDSLQEDTGLNWPNIMKARSDAQDKRDLLTDMSSGTDLIPPDTSLVVFGSLARGEFTQGSDCDWTMLVDGQVNSDNHSSSILVKNKIEDAQMVKPGATGVFGSLTFSHELVHQIGGDEDTNKNTTRRMLLILESVAIQDGQKHSSLVHERVVKQVVKRYLEKEADLLSPEGSRRVPRFLLNDVVRYWRTVAVDYAGKVRDREADKWALRNIKLRMSRKLIFVSGMLTCFDYVLNPHDSEGKIDLFEDKGSRILSVQNHLLECVRLTPLEILARAILNYSPDDVCKKKLATGLLGTYDGFLGMLNTKSDRDHLKTLMPTNAGSDEIFNRERKRGRAFQESLIDLFFNTDEKLAAVCKEYGVF